MFYHYLLSCVQGTSDLEDEYGQVIRDVSWDDIEFLHPEDYHLADRE
jgi:hypothetical protein